MNSLLLFPRLRIGFIFLAAAAGLSFCARIHAQDWLTPLELEKFRETEGGDKRIVFYMKAAKMRMDAAALRLQSKSSKPGDPLEFFSLSDLTGGCFQALRSSMVDIQDQIQYKHVRGPELVTGLKSLSAGAKAMQPFFQNIQKVAVEKQDPALYKTAKEGWEYCDSAIRGIEKAMKKYGAQEPYLPK
jgi:hypothetical protein